jgi:transposase-like protein
MANLQKTYTRKFKQEAVQLVKSSGKPMSQVARELGISDSALYHWCKQLQDSSRTILLPFCAVCCRSLRVDTTPGGSALPAGGAKKMLN